MVAERVWVEMPATGTGAAGDPVRAKYPIHGNAFLMHQHGKVYVVFGDESARDEALQHAECRILTDDEGRLFETNLPVPISPWLFSHDRDNRGRPVRLGDIAARLTRRVGIGE